MRSRRIDPIRPVIILLVALSAGATSRVRLAPRLSPGEVVRYRIESSSKTTGKTTSPIVNPEAGSQTNAAIHMLVRLEVLDVAPGGKVRLRAIYEKSSAESESDALDLAASSFADRYNRLDGRAFEVTLDSGGQLTNVQDLTAAVAGQSPKAIAPELSWLQGFFSSGSFPQKEVAVGQKWKSERPVEGALLTGLAWRAESTYLRKEPCGPSAAKASAPQSAGPATAADECAEILTRFEIARAGSARSDATPEDYRRNGLRTSGTWTGSGESLDSISLSSGLYISSTQSSTENMDYLVTSAATGSSVHHVGKVESQTQITLVPSPP